MCHVNGSVCVFELFSFSTFSNCRVAAALSHIIHTSINSCLKEGKRKLSIYSLHLFYDGALPRFSSTCDKHKTNRVKKHTHAPISSSDRKASTQSMFFPPSSQSLSANVHPAVCVCVTQVLLTLSILSIPFSTRPGVYQVWPLMVMSECFTNRKRGLINVISTGLWGHATHLASNSLI